MAAFREGTVVAIEEANDEVTRARVSLPSGVIDAVGFPKMLGPLKDGDRVIVNTTGLELALGTGGIGFILWNLDGPGEVEPGRGHIVKVRYTPWQTEVMAVEAPESEHHALLSEAGSLDGIPVVACSLHSQIAGVAAGIKSARPGARVGYLMTDGAALPLVWSHLLKKLKEHELIDVTATCGHAFGGDLESVNVHSGLLALRYVGRCDVVIVAMGPGVVGTGTRIGFTGMEQGTICDAATALRGRAIACLRVSFADPRGRHLGVSHHSLTALQVAAREPAVVVAPDLEQSQATTLQRQLATLPSRHKIITADGWPGVEMLKSLGVEVTSMERTIDESPETFLAAAAAGAAAAERMVNVAR